MDTFILFQTDPHKTKSSRIFCGVFSTLERAKIAADENGLRCCLSEVDIVECDIDKFDEQ